MQKWSHVLSTLVPLFSLSLSLSHIGVQRAIHLYICIQYKRLECIYKNSRTHRARIYAMGNDRSSKTMIISVPPQTAVKHQKQEVFLSLSSSYSLGEKSRIVDMRTHPTQMCAYNTQLCPQRLLMVVPQEI